MNRYKELHAARCGSILFRAAFPPVFMVPINYRAGDIVHRVWQTTLAVVIGTTRSRVCFFMNRFRKWGYIQFDGRRAVKVYRSLFDILWRAETEEPGISRLMQDSERLCR